MGEMDDWDVPDEPDLCDCEDYDVDILTGRAHCPCCGRAWWLTTEQLNQELKWNAELCEAIAEEYDKREQDKR